MNESENLAREVLADALKQEEGQAREAFINQACKGDPTLRHFVTELLQVQAGGGPFVAPKPPVSLLDRDGEVNPRLEPQQISAPQPGDRVGRYRILQQIGEGGHGLVYMAEQEEPVRRKVALKVIKLGMDTAYVVARFEAERQALALMDHPNIARVFDGGATETGRPYFVMELVRGVPITDFCDQGKLGTRERLELFIQVCHAVQHAHQKGIIHRDIKPSNILVTINDGVPVPKVIDFGIAKAMEVPLTEKTLFTRFELFLGTPAYMSPEQAVLTSLDVDTRGDIYSLGVLLYELLTGTTPFDGKALLAAGLDEFRRTIREQDPVLPSNRLKALLPEALTTAASRRGTEAPKLIQSLRGDLDWIVVKCLEKNRARRYETANALAMDVMRYLRNEPVLARPPAKLYRLQKMVRRNKVLFASAGAVTAALVIGLVVSLFLLFQERVARAAAVAAEHKAETEILNTQETVRLLREILNRAGSVKGLDTRPLIDFLDRTAREMPLNLKKDPQLEQEVRNTLALLYLDFGEEQKAEDMVRKALAISSEHPGDNGSVPIEALMVLSEVLLGEKKYADAEQFFDESPIVLARLQAKDPRILSIRAVLYARLGRWNKAVADFSTLIQVAPDYEEAYLSLAALLVQTGDAATYRSLRGRILARFGTGARSSSLANQRATVCLLLPATDAELALAAQQADLAMSLGQGRSNEAWCQFCKGLAEYRQGHSSDALSWIRRSLAAKGENGRLGVECYMVLSMAEHQLGHDKEAQEAFFKGATVLQSQMPSLEGGDLTGGWIDWLSANALMHEAQGFF